MNSITFTLEGREGRHLYEQIYEHIKQEIKAGKLLYGEKLPSTRSLAEYLQVSRSTVDLAYEQLAAEGYIEARPYKGYFVCHMEELFDLPVREKPEEFWQEEREKDFFVDFSTSAVDLEEFPYDTWRRIYRKVFDVRGKSIFLPGNGQGDRELRLMLCRYLHSSRGVNCEPEQIVVGAGNEYLLMLLDKVLVSAQGSQTGEERAKRPVIALENPTYKKAGLLFESMGYPVAPVEMDAYGMRVDALEQSGAGLAYVMPSHQYPTGVVMPIRRRQELLKWAAKEPGRYLIEDDYDSEFRYKGKPIPALQASDRQDSVIYIGTFSKAISPAIRISYMVLPVRLMAEYHKACGYLSTTVQRTEQAVLTEFIRGGYFERHLNRMRKVYREKHDRMLSLLKPFEKAFTVSGEHAGLHLILTDRNGRSEKELIRKAAEHGIRVYGMEELLLHQDTGTGRPASVLLGYGGLSGKEMEEGISLLGKIWI